MAGNGEVKGVAVSGKCPVTPVLEKVLLRLSDVEVVCADVVMKVLAEGKVELFAFGRSLKDVGEYVKTLERRVGALEGQVLLMIAQKKDPLVMAWGGAGAQAAGAFDSELEKGRDEHDG